MNYLVIGAGGTGGALGAYLARGGKEVTLIARGTHLAAIQAEGLRVVRPGNGFSVSPAATDTDHYEGSPDVVFVCVKGYSLENLIPFLERITDGNTVIMRPAADHGGQARR